MVPSHKSNTVDAVMPIGRTIVALVVLLVLTVPLFVCMPLNSDTALFDVQADRVLKDGVLYRDIIEPNLPGVVWLHLAVRSVVGWSTEAMRFADLILFGGVLCLFGRLLPSAEKRVAFAFVAAFFYISCNEWCHCQRDTWMLLPAATAMWTRIRRKSSRYASWLSVFEGICWGVAFWIKPHVAIPASSVILFDVVRSHDRGAITRQTLLVILGGLIAAAPGIAWMSSSGAWPHFLEMMFDWNPEYLQAGRERQSVDRWIFMFRRFSPWWCVHVLALPLAVRTIWNCRSVFPGDTDRTSDNTGTLAALYMGWLVQSLALQHAMDYIHVPAIVLGILVLSSYRWNLSIAPRRGVVVTFLLLAALASPILRPQRLSQWANCWKSGSTHEVKSQLALGNFPQWNELNRVREFLRDQNLSDGELTCLNVHSVHLFRELNVQPATRYWSVSILQELFPSRARQIERTVRESGTRFIVTEAMESGMNGRQVNVSTYPWNLPVVFEAGGYRVHATSGDAHASTSNLSTHFR